jgi:hypothetical protein
MLFGQGKKMSVLKLMLSELIKNYFFLIRLVGGGVQLGTLGTAATDWPIVACPGWL